MDFKGTFDTARKEYGLGGEYFSIEDGEEKKVRILTSPVAYQSTSEYGGEVKTRVQFLCYVWDYLDSKVRLYFMPLTVMGQIGEYQGSTDYSFEPEGDIPYDITIKRIKDARFTKYTVLPARANTDTPPEAMEVLQGLKPISQILERLKAKQNAQDDAPLPEEEHG